MKKRNKLCAEESSTEQNGNKKNCFLFVTPSESTFCAWVLRVFSHQCLTENDLPVIPCSGETRAQKVFKESVWEGCLSKNNTLTKRTVSRPSQKLFTVQNQRVPNKSDFLSWTSTQVWPSSPVMCLGCCTSSNNMEEAVQNCTQMVHLFWCNFPPKLQLFWRWKQTSLTLFLVTFRKTVSIICRVSSWTFKKKQNQSQVHVECVVAICASPFGFPIKPSASANYHSGGFVNVHHLTQTKEHKMMACTKRSSSHITVILLVLFWARAKCWNWFFAGRQKILDCCSPLALPGVILSAFHIALDHIGNPFKPNCAISCPVQSKCNIRDSVKTNLYLHGCWSCEVHHW